MSFLGPNPQESQQYQVLAPGSSNQGKTRVQAQPSPLLAETEQTTSWL